VPVAYQRQHGIVHCQRECLRVLHVVAIVIVNEDDGAFSQNDFARTQISCGQQAPALAALGSHQFRTELMVLRRGLLLHSLHVLLDR
jgi:hypothetical protein